MGREAISDETYSVVMAAVKTLHGLMRGRTRNWQVTDKHQVRPVGQAALPDFETVAKDGLLIGEVLERAHAEIHYKQTDGSRRAVEAARNGVEKILGATRAKLDAACKRFDATPEDEREMFGFFKRPESVGVPIANLLGCFAKGTNVEVAKAHLKAMGYSLVRGAASESGPKVEVRATAKSLTPPKGHGAVAAAEVQADIDAAAAEAAAQNAASDETSDETSDENDETASA
jgi:hypothetical protein